MTDEQKEIQQLARKFSREEILPKAAEYDRTMDYPWEIIKQVCDYKVPAKNLCISKYGNFTHLWLTNPLYPEFVSQLFFESRISCMQTLN